MTGQTTIPARSAGDGGPWVADPKQHKLKKNALVSDTGAFCVIGSGLADDPEHGIVPRFAAHKCMARLVAEMRHVDDGRRIIRQHMQFAARRQAHQALARLQDGEGAQQPRGIEFLCHARDLGLCAAAVHWLGTIM